MEDVDGVMNAEPHEVYSGDVEPRTVVSREDSQRPGAHLPVKKIFVGGFKEDTKKNHHLWNYVDSMGKLKWCKSWLIETIEKITTFLSYYDYDFINKIVTQNFHNVNNIQNSEEKSCGNNIVLHLAKMFFKTLVVIV